VIGGANEEGPHRHELITLVGGIKGIPARILVDCGATNNFIDEDFLLNSGLISKVKETPNFVKLTNGQRQLSSTCLPTAHTHINTYKDKLTYHSTPLESYDAILGKEWLTDLNPAVDWQANIIRFMRCGKHHTLQTPFEELSIEPSARHLVLLFTELEQSFKRGGSHVPVRHQRSSRGRRF